MAREPDTIYRGDPTRTPPCSGPHPAGLPLVIGGVLPFCPYCDSPYRGPHRRDTTDQRQRQQILRDWKTRYGNLCPGTPWCDTPDQPHPVVHGELTVDHRAAQAAGGEASGERAVICRAADSRKK